MCSALLTTDQLPVICLTEKFIGCVIYSYLCWKSKNYTKGKLKSWFAKILSGRYDVFWRFLFEFFLFSVRLFPSIMYMQPTPS
jgi:hypothetical protein